MPTDSSFSRVLELFGRGKGYFSTRYTRQLVDQATVKKMCTMHHCHHIGTITRTHNGALAGASKANEPQITEDEKKTGNRMSSRLSGAVNRKNEEATETPVPALRVMRLQAPQLHSPSAGSLESKTVCLQNSLCLPDSLGVIVGETFTAYLGVLNPSSTQKVRNMTLHAQLQTPTNRWQLGCNGLEQHPIDMEPSSSKDCIVSHAIDEPGQHILRVEVSYQSVDADGASTGTKSFRKFYRFQVTHPFRISNQIVRTGDDSCIITVHVEYTPADDDIAPMALSCDFQPSEGLEAERIDLVQQSDGSDSATLLYDESCVMQKKDELSFMFSIKAVSKEAILKGIAAGDVLGSTVLQWRKTMGERGRIISQPLYCPRCRPNLDLHDPDNIFVVHRSGLSVDVAAAAATRDPSSTLHQEFPITVEPIDPPSEMTLDVPSTVQFLVVNHSPQPMTLQLQFHLIHMKGIAVTGRSFQTLGVVSPNGGSIVASVDFLPLAPGLLRVQGCSVTDLASGREIPMPPLFHVFVEAPSPVGVPRLE